MEWRAFHLYEKTIHNLSLFHRQKKLEFWQYKSEKYLNEMHAGV